jgi:uncharacterized membrane-anchored protein YhcB (DUF1043 family)
MEFDLIRLLWFAGGLLVGAAAAVLLARRSDRVAEERAASLETELEDTRQELEGQAEQVARHFEQTSDLFRKLTEEYTRMYAHLADGARQFCAGDVPALGRGFDGPLLGRNGDPAPSDEERPASPNGGAE